MISRKCISSIILLFMSVFALNAAEKNEKVTVKLSVSVAKSGARHFRLKSLRSVELIVSFSLPQTLLR